MAEKTFLIISKIVYGVLIIQSFLAMFSSLGNNYDVPFFKRNDTILNKYNYENTTVNQTYLTDIQFGNYSSDYDLYGLTGEPIEKCYLGYCDNTTEQTSNNCS